MMAAARGEANRDLKWTDYECELLLYGALNYKVKTSSENVDLESMKTKYDDILVMMRAEMPADKTERPVKEYIHLRSEMTKAILSTKLKNEKAKIQASCRLRKEKWTWMGGYALL